MNTTNIAKLAESVATTAHNGQVRRGRGGKPYITHPAAVAALLTDHGDAAVAAAWLHDVMEDTHLNAGHLRQHGFPEDVVEAVIALTRRDGQPYDDYIQSVSRHPLARRVKIADMLHNLSGTPSPAAVKRYHMSLAFLLDL